MNELMMLIHLPVTTGSASSTNEAILFKHCGRLFYSHQVSGILKRTPSRKSDKITAVLYRSNVIFHNNEAVPVPVAKDRVSAGHS